ncbi:hypothetical protein [Aquamicrobium terrae]
MPTNVTSARSVAKLTEALATPGAAAIAFSTRRTQDAQVMPSMPIWSFGAETGTDPVRICFVAAFIVLQLPSWVVASTDKGSSDGKVKSFFLYAANVAKNRRRSSGRS